MLKLQQLCEAVKKTGSGGLEAGEANPMWPILAGTDCYPDPCLHSESQVACDVLSSLITCNEVLYTE